MARICAVCQRPPREGEEMFPIRLREQEDLDATGRDKLALYSACRECVEAHRIRVAHRQGCDPSQITNHAMC
jgi:hypothetical protein